MQSYALLDARTPGIVNIISNKDCKEWRIDALRKSKCVCAPLCFRWNVVYVPLIVFLKLDCSKT